MKFSGNILFALGVSVALPMAPAHAYLDAGSVSMALQVVIGGVATALMFGKLYLNRIMAFFRGEKTVDTNSSSSTEQ